MFPGTGQFTGSRARIVEDGRAIPFEAVQKGESVPRAFGDATTARAAVIVSLALQTEVALRRAGMKAGEALYVEGGFRRNESYNTLLAGLCRGSRVSLTSMKEATAFGAAITGKLAREGLEPAQVERLFEIELSPVAGRELPGLEAYREEFHRRLAAV
jgi:sugar (pentulose or hexulose) kinase